MDFLDFLSWLPSDPAGSRSRERSPRENFAYAIALVVFPFVEFMIVLFGDLWEHQVVALVALPLAFSLASFALCRHLQLAGGRTLLATLGCAAWCVLAGAVALLLGVFASFYSGF